MSYEPRSEMFVKPVLSSITESGRLIHTLHLRYPRIIHSEIMTHRVFSRNARSSRAVPLSTMIEEIATRPFIPWHWTRNQPGMQGQETYSLSDINKLETIWLKARDEAVVHALKLGISEDDGGCGVHKQIVNRLLEPFAWIDTLITSTQWANFFHLRVHMKAEPHFKDLALMVKDTIEVTEPNKLLHNVWHIPYIKDEWVTLWKDAPSYNERLALILKISAARCARISYTPFDGNGSIQKELERFNLLVSDDAVHASPLEHQAKEYLGFGDDTLGGNLGRGWIQFRKTIPNEAIYD